MAGPSRNQRFAIGIVFTAIAVFFAIWAFDKGCLQGTQPQIVQVFLPLAAGFAAWSFSGTIRINAENLGLLPGAIIGAVGGGAVWIGTAFMLMPRADEACKRESPRAQLFSAVSGDRTMRGDYAFLLGGDRQAGKRILSNGPGTLARLEAVDREKLTEVEQIHRSTNIGRGHLYLALTAEMLESQKDMATSHASQSLKWTATALEELAGLSKLSALPSSAERYASYNAWLKEENYEQFIYQLVGRAHLLGYKLGNKNYSGAVAAFRKVSRTYRTDNGLMSEPLIVWFCRRHPKEASICS